MWKFDLVSVIKIAKGPIPQPLKMGKAQPMERCSNAMNLPPSLQVNFKRTASLNRSNCFANKGFTFEDEFGVD
jgi:hypothetical protein